MAAPPSAYKDRHFLAVIGDEVSRVQIYVGDVSVISHTGQDSVTGLLLAGIGVWLRDLFGCQPSSNEKWLKALVACNSAA